MPPGSETPPLLPLLPGAGSSLCVCTSGATGALTPSCAPPGGWCWTQRHGRCCQGAQTGTSSSQWCAIHQVRPPSLPLQAPFPPGFSPTAALAPSVSHRSMAPFPLHLPHVVEQVLPLLPIPHGSVSTTSSAPLLQLPPTWPLPTSLFSPVQMVSSWPSAPTTTSSTSTAWGRGNASTAASAAAR